MFQFILNLFRPNRLKDVEQHLATADDHLTAHVDALMEAQDAAADHILEQQDKISGLSLAIGMAKSQINTASDHLDAISAKLDALPKTTNAA